MWKELLCVADLTVVVVLQKAVAAEVKEALQSQVAQGELVPVE